MNEPIGAPEQELGVLPLFMQDGIVEGDRGIVCKRAQQAELVMRIQSEAWLMSEIDEADQALLIDKRQAYFRAQLSHGLNQRGGQSLVKSWGALLEFFFDDRLIARQQVVCKRLDAHDRLERIHDFGLQIGQIELHHHGMRESS